MAVFIVRGAPGSGKSTLAGKIKDFHASIGMDCRIVETDDYFMIDGKYMFDYGNLPVAHKDCYDRFKAIVDSKVNVVVANTNVLRAHYEPYVDYAREVNTPCYIIRCEGDHGSIHGVSRERIEDMRNRMQSDNREITEFRLSEMFRAVSDLFGGNQNFEQQEDAKRYWRSCYAFPLRERTE